MKQCASCGTTLEFTPDNFPRKGRGRLGNRCRPCERKSRTSGEQGDRRRAYSRAYCKDWRKRNPGYYRQVQRTERDKEANRIRARRWIKENKDRFRESVRNSQRKRLRNDPMFRLKLNIRRRINRIVNHGKASARTEAILGYTMQELRTHLQRQFAPGMSWENYGSHWQIDHILPVASFNIQEIGDAEFKACWSLTNLRPLWSDKNREKRDQRLHLL